MLTGKAVKLCPTTVQRGCHLTRLESVVAGNHFITRASALSAAEVSLSPSRQGRSKSRSVRIVEGTGSNRYCHASFLLRDIETAVRRSTDREPEDLAPSRWFTGV
jgi:hypothetical protein